jgi:hypothetical protein
VNGQSDKKKGSTGRQELVHAVPESEIGRGSRTHARGMYPGSCNQISNDMCSHKRESPETPQNEKVMCISFYISIAAQHIFPYRPDNGDDVTGCSFLDM